MSKLDNLTDREIDTEDLESVSGGNWWCWNPCYKPQPRCEEKRRCDWDPPCNKRKYC